MNISDEAVEAAAKAWIERVIKPGSWTLEENLRAALEAAAPHLVAEQQVKLDAVRELAEDAAAQPASEIAPVRGFGSLVLAALDTNPYRSARVGE